MGNFSGWVGRGETIDQDRGIIERMKAALSPSGATPAESAEGVGLVLDPAPNDSGRLGRVDDYVGVLVGRVGFDHPELERISKTDGEIAAMIRGYRRFGTDVLRFIRGGFALGIVEVHGRDALLAIDRLGGRFPLFYAKVGDQWMFSTDGNVLHAHPSFAPDIDSQALFNYLYFANVPSPRTSRVDLKQLMPGTFLRLQDGRERVESYWQPEYVDDRNVSVEELSEEFREVLRRNVRLDIAGETRRGCFLSGGTDSSTIAGMLSELEGAPAETFSIGFEAEGYDEMEYARCASEHFGTQQHEYYLTPEDVLQAIPRVAAAYESPFGNASAVPVYHCALLGKRNGIGRLLAGDGGDELFAGNQRYAAQHVFEYYKLAPSIIRSTLLEPIAFGMPGAAAVTPLRKLGSYIRQAKRPMPDRMESYNHLERAGIERVIHPDFLASIDPEEPRRSMREVYQAASAETMLNRMLALDLKMTLTDSDLPKVSRMCERAGVEVAYPFLSDELVEFSLKVPARLKLKGLKLRWFMKNALRDYLPQKILRKKKHGFGLPFGIWMRNNEGLREFARENLASVGSRGIVRSEYLDELVRLHEDSHATYYGVMIWMLVMLEQWFVLQRRPSAVSG